MSDSVKIDLWRDGRAALLGALAELPVRQRSRLATAALYALRTAGFFGGWIEYHYSATDFATLIGRSDEYVMRLIRNRELQPVSEDARGWMIPASTGQAWLDSRRFGKSTTLSSIETGLVGEKVSHKEGHLGTEPGTGTVIDAVIDHAPDLRGRCQVEGLSTKRTRKRLQNKGVTRSDVGSDAAATAQAPGTPAVSAGPDAGLGRVGGGSRAAGSAQIHMGDND